MTVLFTVADANLRGGTEILAFHLLHELNASNYECRLLSVKPYRGSDPMVISFSENDYEKWLRLHASPINKLLGSIRSDAFLCHLIAAKADEFGAEWIINHTYDICSAIPTRGKRKTAQVFNWSIRGYEASLEHLIRRKSFVSRGLSKVVLFSQKRRWHSAIPAFTRLVMLTNAAHKEVKEIYPSVNDEQLITIPDPLMQKEDSNVLTSLRNKNLVFVGRLSHEKGVMRLLRIWESIVKSLPDYTLKIYGTGDARKEMEAYIADHHISGVSFMGFCDNLKEIYSQADLLLMTSDSEGFGMVLIEAMYYGVPCISFDCPVAPGEIIAEAGVAIHCFDEERYAEEVIELLNNPAKMTDLQKKAIRRASEYYIDKVLVKWHEMIEHHSETRC